MPPGIADATVPNPIFNLTPVATVDEGNNWINLRWGPLSLLNPVTNTTLGNYALTTGSAVVDTIPTTQANFSLVPRTDFFGNARPETGSDHLFDPGAVELSSTGGGGGGCGATVTGGPLAFGNQAIGTTSAAMTLTVTNGCTTALSGGTFTFGGGTPQPFSHPGGGGGGVCGGTLAAGASCTYRVVFRPTTATTYSRTLTIAYTGATVTGSPVTLTGTGVTPGTLRFTSATNATLTGGGLLSFGSPAGRAVTTSVVTVTVTVAPVTITADAVSNLIGTNFALTGTTCPSTPVAIGGTCTFSVQYTPPARLPFIPRFGFLTVTDDAAGSPQTLTLMGQ